MADLSNIQATQAVKIIGSDSVGTEVTPVGSTTIGAMKVDVWGFSALFGFANASNWMKLGVYDEVEASADGDNLSLAFKESGAIIGRATLEFNSAQSWSMSLTRHINEADGDPLLDDDGEYLILD